MISGTLSIGKQEEADPCRACEVKAGGPKMISMAESLTRARRLILGGNIYNATELAGAFGDLGTLIPFVIGYIVVDRLDPVGILVSLGILKILWSILQNSGTNPTDESYRRCCNLQSWYSHARHDLGSGIFSAFVWIILALTGAVSWLNRITAKPVIRGIMLGPRH